MEQSPLHNEEQPPQPNSRLLVILHYMKSCRDSVLKTIGIYVHANKITIARIPATMGAIAIDQVSHPAGASTYAISMLFDWLDGAVARSCKGMSTREGTVLDPLVDKASNYMALSYQMIKHIDDISLLTVASLSMVLNLISQRQRGPFKDQFADGWRGVVSPQLCEPVASEKNVEAIKANYIGKVKQWIECGSIATLFLAGHNDETRLVGVIGLAISSLFSLVSTLKRYLRKEPK